MRGADLLSSTQGQISYYSILIQYIPIYPKHGLDGIDGTM